MDTKDLKLFLTIAQVQSISRTADSLYMSQSTVTNRLQRLEHSLGYALFHRTQTGVHLTQEGQRFLPLAEQMVTLEEQMLSEAAPDVPTLRVMSGRAFVSTDVPQCLTQLAKQMSVHLEVRMGLYGEMSEALLANQVDFCFLGEPIYHPQIRRLICPADHIDLIVPLRHHLAHQFTGIEALANEPFIAFSRAASSPFRKRVTTLLAEAGVYPNVRMELDSIDGIKAMVSYGLGVSLLPRRTLHDADAKGYAVIRINDDRWIRPTEIAYPAGIEDRVLTRTFLDIVRAYYMDVELRERHRWTSGKLT